MGSSNSIASQMRIVFFQNVVQLLTISRKAQEIKTMFQLCQKYEIEHIYKSIHKFYL